MEISHHISVPRESGIHYYAYLFANHHRILHPFAIPRLAADLVGLYVIVTLHFDSVVRAVAHTTWRT